MGGGGSILLISKFSCIFQSSPGGKVPNGGRFAIFPRLLVVLERFSRRRLQGVKAIDSSQVYL